MCFVDVVHCVSRTVCFVHFAHIFRVKLCISYIVIASLVLVYNVCACAHYPAVFQTLQNILAEKKLKNCNTLLLMGMLADDVLFLNLMVTGCVATTMAICITKVNKLQQVL